MSGRDVKRAYDNRRRAAQAQATRQRITDAARELLLARGYRGTTMAEVAAVAQTSAETVQKAFGTKAALVKATYDVTLGGDDEPVALRDRPEFAALLAQTDPRRAIELYAAISRRLWERLGPLLEVLIQGAQAGEPDLVELVATIRGESRIGASGMVRHLAAMGTLRPGLDLDHAADELWLLIQPEQFALLVGERGWSLDEAQAWLARAAAALLAPT